MSATDRRLPARVRGFTYIGLLILLAILSIVAAASLQVGVLVQRRAAEQELLLIGKEFRLALQSYANVTPAGQNRSPSRIEDLLKDPRFPGLKRHLRKIYVDPITGNQQWGVVLNLERSGIAGIHSLSPDKPIMAKLLPQGFPEFSNKKSYQEWVF